MAYTENFNLKTADASDLVSGFVADYNANLGKIDNLPLPVQTGGNTQLSYYKFADGTVFMWGRVDTGQRYVCSTEFEGHAFASDAFTVTWPVTLAGTSPVVLANVETDVNPDIFVQTSNITASAGTFMFLANFNESTGAYGPVNNKALHLFVVGRWK